MFKLHMDKLKYLARYKRLLEKNWRYQSAFEASLEYKLLYCDQSNTPPININMKFFAIFVLAALAICACNANEEPAASAQVVASKLEPTAESSSSADEAQARGKRGILVGAYTAPVAAAAVEVASPYVAPVAYTYSAAYPYAYAPYASYYGYPAVYV